MLLFVGYKLKVIWEVFLVYVVFKEVVAIRVGGILILGILICIWSKIIKEY